jgi:hypothetical protein
VPVGREIAKLLDWDDHCPSRACFFAALALEVLAYDRLQRWWYFRNLKP